MSRLRNTILAMSLVVAAAGSANAQEPTYDPTQLPAIHGTVAQYTLTPRGDVDGLILADGLEVQVSPRMSTELVYAVRPGESVTIHGLKARAEPMMLAMSITNDMTHVTVVTEGQHRSRGRDRDAAIEAQGTVKAQLHDVNGEMDGVLLQDGTVVHLPPPEAQRLGAQLAIGQTIYASGAGNSGVLGRVVAAHLLGQTKETAKAIVAPGDDEHGGRGGRHGDAGHGGQRGSDVRSGGDAAHGQGAP